MWPDNETNKDLLGFNVHCELIRDVVTDPDLLPVVLGVFGDWGGGKSSIMRMLQEELKADAYEDVVCLYFNGWMFEGYEDAKSALLSSILLELGENKRFGDKVKEKVVNLLGRIQWMEVGKLAVKHVGVPLAVGAMTGGVGGVHSFLVSLLNRSHSGPEEAGKIAEKEGEKKGEENWLDKVLAAPAKPDLLEVRKFRGDFERMLSETGMRSLVVLIDDLDRCLPDRIIETLEAIKLFAAVPKTSFVIGADPRIVRHAIATRFANQKAGGEPDADGDAEDYDLVQDYLEKLIQVPYYLPRLSPAEMETYINQLLCEKHLPDPGRTLVLDSVKAKRRENCFGPFTYGDVREALGEDLPTELALQLAWSGAVSLSLTEGLKGNPRQVKRMLNAMVLRTKLAGIAKLEIRPEVLAKLMVLEYTAPKRFRELDAWQTAAKGVPGPLGRLEEEARGDAKPADGKAEEGLAEWRKPAVRSWLAMEPALAGVDMRDYFWIARDRTKSTLGSVSMVSPLVKRLFTQLVGDSAGERAIAVKAVSGLNNSETENLLALLEQHVIRHPGQEGGYVALNELAGAGTLGAVATLLLAVQKAPKEDMTPTVPNLLSMLAGSDASLRGQIRPVMDALQKDGRTKVARAAKIAINNLDA